MKIYAISGLGADHRVFDFLLLNHPIQVLKWIPPIPEESLHAYAQRLISQINNEDEFILIGVSFGGMLAIEIQKQLQPKLTILISSASNRYDLPNYYQWVGRLQLLSLIPHGWFKLPKVLADWLFDAQQKEILHNIIEDTDTKFLKWALIAISQWKEDQAHHVLRIHGSKDKLIPLAKREGIITIENTGHFMIVDSAKILSDIINDKIIDLERS